ncbi:MAG: aminotransferase class I/II-fold pyridoxal phosphate-dependent enzyme [Candidatus Kryptonium sp.]|nr:aminotransferase class I/II-fold pyridoxal phosphate-dependent enzyme [Candidatus Kryptonium sp.]MCX7762032.1 aminotransferase class I/II-fold pyridoxal phosphate-dependent enzyme [Candidatus Kryptonium sp.]MDW8108364.1 aminotransferase class I/II-fold pyridoxal phosphate-dependent enzyme [Candidatus Kryptonium sp.]
METLFTYFLGPKGENIELFKKLIHKAIEWNKRWREDFFDDPSVYPENFFSSETYKIESENLEKIFDEFLKRLEGNLPYFHPRYSAQMLKDPSIPALLAYFAVMLTNPNNHAYEGGPVTTEMEMEVVEDLLKLVGFKEGWGHLTSGGSLANLEALWAVRDLRKDGIAVFSKGSHYSWKRICSILKVDFVEIDVDENYRIDLDQLESVLKRNKVMFVMANFGTTGAGAVDPLVDILNLKEKYDFHLHIDAAYGGYFRTLIIDGEYKLIDFSMLNVPLKKFVYDNLLAISEADSLTIDPHKHGLVMYGAGGVLYKDENLRQVILNTSPYTYHKKDKPNIGMFQLEGSRPGASAGAVWLTHRVIPLNRNGFGEILAQTLKTANYLYQKIKNLDGFAPLTQPDLDIFCFYRHDGNFKLSEINQKTLKIYNRLSVENPNAKFILSKFIVDKLTAQKINHNFEIDDESLTTLRSVFIKHWNTISERNNYVDMLVDELLKD